MEKNNDRKEKGSYVLPDVVPFALCGAVLGIVLEKNKEAKIIFEQIKENCQTPGCKEAFSKIEKNTPKGDKIIKEIIKSAGYDYNKPPSGAINQMAVGKSMFYGTKNLIIRYTKKFTPWVKSDSQRNMDFTELVMSIDDFIKLGFNRVSEQEKGKYRVTAESSATLVLVVFIKAMLEVRPMNLNRMEQLPMYVKGKKLYTIKAVNSGVIPRRVRRAISSDYLDAGFILKHDEKLDDIAKRWYQCRIVYSGPDEFCREQNLSNKERLDAANISNEIRECDKAIGYPREKTGKSKN